MGVLPSQIMSELLHFIFRGQVFSPDDGIDLYKQILSSETAWPPFRTRDKTDRENITILR